MAATARKGRLPVDRGNADLIFIEQAPVFPPAVWSVSPPVAVVGVFTDR
jgi:hypothetical protein